MVEGETFGMMVMFTRGNSRMALIMVRENICGQMANNMKDNGRRINNMEKER